MTMAIAGGACLSIVLSGGLAAAHASGALGGDGGSGPTPTTPDASPSPSPAAAPSGGGGSGGADGYGAGSSSDHSVGGNVVNHRFRMATPLPLWLTSDASGGIITTAGPGNMQLRLGVCDGVSKDGVKRYSVRNTTNGKFLLHNGQGGLNWGEASAPEACVVREVSRCEQAFPGKGLEALRFGANHVLKVERPTIGSRATLVPVNSPSYNTNNKARMSEICMSTQ